MKPDKDQMMKDGDIYHTDSAAVLLPVFRAHFIKLTFPSAA